MGKFGVLWGRKIMESHKATHVIYRQHREINRRQATLVNTDRDAVRFCNGVRSKRGLCFAGLSGEHFSLVGIDVRGDVKISRSLTSARRERDGIRTTALFTIEANRNRQSRANSSTRTSIGICWDRNTSSSDWRTGSHRDKKCSSMASFAWGKITETSRNMESSTETTNFKIKRFARGNTLKRLFYKAKQGRLAREGFGVTDDTSSLHLESAIRLEIAILGPRTVHKGECARMEAKH